MSEETKPKKTLEEMEGDLLEAFEKAKDLGKNASIFHEDSIEALTAMGTIAQAVVAVRKEQRESAKPIVGPTIAR